MRISDWSSDVCSSDLLIEDGKVTAPVKGATLIGNGPETMQKVKMVGHDLALDDGVGVCGKDGQSVPVGVGQPSLLIDGLTVGGTKACGPGLGIGDWGLERADSRLPCRSAERRVGEYGYSQCSYRWSPYHKKKKKKK